MKNIFKIQVIFNLIFMLIYSQFANGVEVTLSDASGVTVTCELSDTLTINNTGDIDATVVNNCLTATGDAPGYNVSPLSLSIQEGASKTFSISLATTPASPVTLSIGSSNTSVATVTPTSTTLSNTNPVTIIVTGKTVTANTNFTISVSTNSSYANGNISGTIPRIAATITDSSTTTPNPEPPGPTTCTAPTCVQKDVLSAQSFIPGPSRFSGTMVDNNTFAMRVKPTGAGAAGLALSLEVVNAEGGADIAEYDVALSYIAGSFTETTNKNSATIGIPAPCVTVGSSFNYKYQLLIDTTWDSASTSISSQYCRLKSNTILYVNIKPRGSQGCGTSKRSCRQQLIIGFNITAP